MDCDESCEEYEDGELAILRKLVFVLLASLVYTLIYMGNNMVFVLIKTSMGCDPWSRCNLFIWRGLLSKLATVPM